MYHVRRNYDFYYHTQKLPIETVTFYGRSELMEHSNTRRLEAIQLLEAYGNDTRNLPKDNENCHDWTVKALGLHEAAKLAPIGTEKYWKRLIGKGPISIGRQLIEDGKPWVRKSIMQPARELPADATFGRAEESRPIGRLDLQNYAHLMGGVKKK
ncbi:hypothetical protein AAWM_10098 [Aspergillus awamori]|uniref:Uncharacterized protein n=1 Tax=Aspergillus awamori TaxID=105351 RepID=A0A401L6L9_ASPAW|nr:hypothetical protein AAWM_10098 [Aspergillus awamori]GKZ58940.1 hypothetical protein AnigIFM49718_004785 [Aspergillus niger]